MTKMKVVQEDIFKKIEDKKTEIIGGKLFDSKSKNIRTYEKVRGINLTTEIVRENIQEVEININPTKKGNTRRTENRIKEYQENGTAFIITLCEAEGKGLRNTAKKLNELGIKTPGGKEWQPQQIKQVRKMMNQQDYTQFKEPPPPPSLSEQELIAPTIKSDFHDGFAEGMYDTLILIKRIFGSKPNETTEEKVKRLEAIESFLDFNIKQQENNRKGVTNGSRRF